jgi:hypothetical protein
MNCDHNPTMLHAYGVYEIAGRPRDFPMNEVCLCDKCGAELWEKIKDSVAAQRMHYAIRPCHPGTNHNTVLEDNK